VKKIVSNFMCENGLERTTKTIPEGIFADITFFRPFSVVENRGLNFSIRFFPENGLQGTTMKVGPPFSHGTSKTIPKVIFVVITFFLPVSGVES